MRYAIKIRTRYLLVDGEEIADLNAQGNAVRRYIPGAAIDERVAQVEANNAVSYIHTDRQNSVIAISDSAGAITKRRAYGSFLKCYRAARYLSTSGETDATQMAGTGGASHPFGYTGRRYEPDLNIYYCRARWYDPNLGALRAFSGSKRSPGPFSLLSKPPPKSLRPIP